MTWLLIPFPPSCQVNTRIIAIAVKSDIGLFVVTRAVDLIGIIYWSIFHTTVLCGSVFHTGGVVCGSIFHVRITAQKDLPERTLDQKSGISSSRWFKNPLSTWVIVRQSKDNKVASFLISVISDLPQAPLVLTGKSQQYFRSSFS